MGTRKEYEAIDWKRLLAEFEVFGPDDEFKQIDTDAFVCSLVDPVPEFVEVFLSSKIERGINRDQAVRDLYGFLLEKRYNERLNLLYFPFEILDDNTYLPEEIINRTPFPHEDGTPKFRHRLNPDFKLQIDKGLSYKKH